MWCFRRLGLWTPYPGDLSKQRLGLNTAQTGLTDNVSCENLGDGAVTEPLGSNGEGATLPSVGRKYLR